MADARRTLARLALLLAGLLAVLVGAWRLSKATTFQLFGRVVASVPVSEKVVALTLDDGPTREGTDVLLAALERYRAKATFFLIGEALARQPEAGRRIAATGHQIGNHSYTHQRMVLKTPGFIRREIETTDALIAKTGFSGEILFRPPYGKKLIGLPWYLRATGRTTVMWSLEPEVDAPDPSSAEGLAGYVLEHVRPGSIVILHAMIDRTGVKRRAFELMLAGLTARGYRLVTVSELLAGREPGAQAGSR